MTSNQLVLDGSQSTKLTLRPQYSWIDDRAVFCNFQQANGQQPDVINVELMIRASGLAQSPMLSPFRPLSVAHPQKAAHVTARATPSGSHSAQNSTRSTNQMTPTLASMHHVTSFDARSAPNNPLLPPSTSTAASTIPQQMGNTPQSGNVLPSPYGFVNTPNGMMAMTWDDIKRQSLLIPANALSHKNASTSKLEMLQESFAVNTWQKLQDHSHPNTKPVNSTQTVRRLRGGYQSGDSSQYDVLPKRKVIDIEHELSLSHKRTFTVQCHSLQIKAKQLLLSPVESIVIQLDFMGNKVRSEPLKLCPNTTITDLRGSLMAEDKYHSLPFAEPHQFQFHIAPNQIRQFIHFLNVRYAIFTVFDSATMFQLGSCRVSMRDYLLQDSDHNDALQEDLEIILCSNTLHQESSSLIQTQWNRSVGETVLSAKLKMSITHKAMNLSDTAHIKYLGWSNKLITNTCDESGALCLWPLTLLSSQENQEQIGKPMFLDPELAPKLQPLPNNHSETNPFERPSVSSKLITDKWSIPMAAIEEISDFPGSDKEWKVRTSNYETMKEFRDRKLEETLNRLSEPDTFTIQPAMGQTVFFEIAFSNPWNQRKTFSIHINDPIDQDRENTLCAELKLVTDVKEIGYLKERCNSSTAMKRNLFLKEDGNEIAVDPNETVYIPFKFQSFGGSLDDGNNDQIQQRVINVAINNDIVGQNEEDSEFQVAAFNVSVEPICFCIDRTFDIYAVQNTKFVGNLPLPPLQNVRASSEEHVISVQCSSDDTAFEVDLENANITLRCDVGPSPDRKRFYMMIYNDRYNIDVNEVWEINIHSYHHQHCHGVLGGIIKSKLHLPSFMDNIGSDRLQFHCDQKNGVNFALTG